MGPTRNAISAILKGHGIIVQAPLVIPNEDVEGLSDRKLSCPSLLQAHMFQPPQVRLFTKSQDGPREDQKVQTLWCPDFRGSPAGGGPVDF